LNKSINKNYTKKNDIQNMSFKELRNKLKNVINNEVNDLNGDQNINTK
jgi:hypothetical protein